MHARFQGLVSLVRKNEMKKLVRIMSRGFWRILPFLLMGCMLTSCDNSDYSNDSSDYDNKSDQHFEKGTEMLQYQWTLRSYTDENGTTHQVSQIRDDKLLRIRFRKDGSFSTYTGENSFGGNYHAQATNTYPCSGGDTAYTGNITLKDLIKTERDESDSDAAYFVNHIGTMEYFDVNTYFLRLMNSEGVTFHFIESSLK